MNNNTKKIIGITGCTVLLIGLFMPTKSFIPMSDLDLINVLAGSKDRVYIYFFTNDIFDDGMKLLVLVIVSIILIFFEKFKWLWLTGVSSLAFLIVIALFNKYNMSAFLNKLKSKEVPEIIYENAKLSVESVRMEYGWIILIIGSIIIIVCAMMKEENSVTN